MKTCGSAVKLRDPRGTARASRNCASLEKLRERSEHQPQRLAAKASSSPGEVCG
ncbi:MAG: hypothetical protein K0R13_1206 [Propionibacteriaceae bacterium]|jgi:hypothetical protein|nr:hypothetical protein [Propionibacteriaceae bacterium]